MVGAMIEYNYEYLKNLMKECTELYQYRCTQNKKYEIKIRYIVFAELKIVSISNQSNIYVIPSSICPLIWNGILTLDEGLYKGKCFKLIILISHDYPFQKGPPVRVFILPPPYHPQIHSINGELELGKFTQKWSTDKNRLYDVLEHIKETFTASCCKKIDVNSPANTEAAILCSRNPSIYHEKVKEHNKQNNVIERPISNSEEEESSLLDYDITDLHRINLNYQEKTEELRSLDFDAIINKMKTFNQDFDSIITEDFEEKELSYSWLKPLS